MGYDLTEVRDGTKEITSILLICQKTCERGVKIFLTITRMLL